MTTFNRALNNFSIALLALVLGGFQGCTIIDTTDLHMEKRMVVTRGSVDTIRVAKEIQEEIKKDPLINAYSLDIQIGQDQTILAGKVATEEDKRKIEEITQRISPNRVISNLTLIPVVADEVLISRVRQTLQAEGIKDVEALEISAHEGIVSVTGSKATHEEVDQILSIILNIEGVKDVESQMKIG